MNAVIKSFALLFWFTLTTDLVGQNNCQTAAPLPYPGEPFSVNGNSANSNDNATSGAVFCSTNIGIGGQIWYQMYWGESHTQLFTMTTEGGITNFDTQIHVYTGYCGSFTCLAGDDDGGAGTSSLVQFYAVPGTYYFIRVGGFGAAMGNFTLSVNGGIGGCTDYNANNYNAQATWDDGTCCYGIPVTMFFGDFGQGFFAEMELYVDGNLVEYVSPGQEEYACIEPGCYVSVVCQTDNLCNSWEGNTYSITINGHNYSGIIPEPEYGSDASYIELGNIGCGCKDPSAMNYNPAAMQDNGSCQYTQVNGTCESAIEILPNSFTYVNNGGQPLVQAYWPQCGMNWQFPGVWFKFVYEGGTILLEAARANQCDPVIAIYDACDGEVLHCNDDDYNTDARLLINCTSGLIPGNTYYILVGAWGPDAQIYLKHRLIDIPGCTDPLAVNFNACASIDDGTCSMGAETCAGDLDYNNSINVADLLIFLTLYNTTCNP